MTAAGDADLRATVIATALELNRIGINQGTSGNVSVREGEGFLVTPSALAYEETLPGDIVRVGMDGVARGPRPPSSEWRIHRDLYAAREDLVAVVHAHPPYATTLACLHRGIPPFHYMIAIAGGDDVRCAPYAPFGSQELSDLAVEAMRDRAACLLGNHGLIAAGPDLAAALALAVEVEALARQYWQAIQVGEPVLLTAEQMREVHRRFAAYRAGKGTMLREEVT